MEQKKTNRIYGWLNERYDLQPLLDFLEHKQVPVHRHSVWYYMGGVTLFLFSVQVFTGILLLLYYQPGVDSAYESIRFLMTKVNFGWLIRSIHSWSANLMVFFIFIHMFSTFFTRAFKKPRELTWITGFVMLLLAMGFGFSGYLLPWNELAFFATKVGTDIAGAVPVVGDAMKILLRGGEDVTGGTLLRFYGFHVAVLPALFTVFLGIHLLFVQRQGMHEPDSIASLPADKKTMIPFFPNFFLRDAFLWLIALNILLYLAVFFPWEIGVKADAFSPAPAGIKPEWYFMFMFQTLKMLPAHILFIEGEIVGVLAFLIAGIAWMLVPFWPEKKTQNGKISPVTLIGILAIGFILVMTIIGYLA
ncbi:MAG: cytochrome bc complex cytochrome b subunit [Calditrichales bacterium]|nr:MAG: cytochrome bc complex cytochrome b subunit [Calditrichales bacterium]